MLKVDFEKDFESIVDSAMDALRQMYMIGGPMPGDKEIREGITNVYYEKGYPLNDDQGRKIIIGLVDNNSDELKEMGYFIVSSAEEHGKSYSIHPLKKVINQP